jgi:hypothetical protein
MGHAVTAQRAGREHREHREDEQQHSTTISTWLRQRDSSTAATGRAKERQSAEDVVDASNCGCLIAHVDGEERLRHLRHAQHRSNTKPTLEISSASPTASSWNGGAGSTILGYFRSSGSRRPIATTVVT